ncbi:MAG: sigma-70 family RNA polymerase sigma factor [Gemmataceae bacterium]
MARGSMYLAAQHLSRIVGRQAYQGISDADLLERLVAQREEAAFELLMWRHERMVRGVCRRVLHNYQDVEDACQATFLTLVCKAGSIGKRQALGGWLYKVAFRIALRAKIQAAKRDRHEKLAGGTLSSQRSSPGEDPHLELRSVVDEELSRLPEKYRIPVVLCYLEGKTNEEAASQLGCPTGTVVTWLARARQRLRTRLARRGFGISAGALALLLSKPDISAAAAPGFLQATLKAALLVTQGQAMSGPISARVVLLTKGALHAMLMDKLKIAAAVIVALCLAGTGSGVLAYRSLVNETEGKTLDAVRPQNPGADRSDKIVAFEGNLQGDDEDADDSKPGADKEKEKEKHKEKSNREARQKAEEVVSQSFTTGQAPGVAVELFNGSIEIVADAENAVKARVVKRNQDVTKERAEEGLKNIEVKMTQEKDTVHISARRLEDKVGHGQEGASAEIRVPAGSVLDLRTSNGSVKLTGGKGKVTVRTSNGEIKVKDSKGALHLHTANGAITVTGATGLAELETTNGPIELQAEKAVVKAQASNSQLHFTGTLAEGAHSMSTSNGRILITLPADAQFKVDAATSNGRITNDFSAGSSKQSARQHIEATVGEKPAATIKLHTSNGGIEIRKKK